MVILIRFVKGIVMHFYCHSQRYFLQPDVTIGRSEVKKKKNACDFNRTVSISSTLCSCDKTAAIDLWLE